MAKTVKYQAGNWYELAPYFTKCMAPVYYNIIISGQSAKRKCYGKYCHTGENYLRVKVAIESSAVTWGFGDDTIVFLPSQVWSVSSKHWYTHWGS